MQTNFDPGEQIYPHLMQKLNLAYALVNENLEIVASNGALGQWIIDSPPDGLIGHNLSDLFPETIGIEDTLQSMLHTPDEVFVLSKIFRSDDEGRGRYFDLRIEPALEFGWNLLVIATDMTEQGHLEQQLMQQRNELSLNISERKRAQDALKSTLDQVQRIKQEWETTADSLSELVCLLDSQGNIIRANRTLEHWNLGQVVNARGRDVRTLFDSNWATFWKHAFEELTQGRPVEYEIEDKTLKRHLHIQVRPTPPQRSSLDQEDVGFATLVISDFTQRQQAEEELRRAKDAAEAANRAKSIFLASMSHELRTPLSVIIGYSELLQEEVLDINHEELLPDVGSINQSGHHLLALIDNIISLSKIEAGELDLHPDIFDIPNLVYNLVAHIEPLIAMNENHLDVQYDPDLGNMYADQSILRQILFNLLTNANKFTKQGAITLTVGREELPEHKSVKVRGGNGNKQESLSHIVFHITDTGIGMTEEQVQQIFEAFVRGDTSAIRRYGDVGLSLAISRRLCQMMGGDITLESVVDQGSTFTVRLPMTVPDQTTKLASLIGPLSDKARPKPQDEAKPSAIPTVKLTPEETQPKVLSSLAESAATNVAVAPLEQASSNLPAVVFESLAPASLPEISKLPVIEGLRTADLANILIIDDNRDIRRMLAKRLQGEGHTIETAENGWQGLELAHRQPFDLIITDIMMPEMNGYQLLEKFKDDQALRHIPIIIISAIDNMDSVIKCIEMGAEDYLFKPFNNILLKARVAASLEKKILRDHEQAYLRQLQIEQEKSERLLLNVLPKPIADRLKQEPGAIADSFPEVTVLFADIVGFTQLSAQISPIELVGLLNEIFSAFDNIAERHGLEKIKTIGDSYMVVGGLPMPQPNHAEAIANMALDMLQVINRLNEDSGRDHNIRIGINTGPVIAGVIGSKKFIYDLWGDTVNTASRMESHGRVGQIQMSAITYAHLGDKYVCEKRGVIEVKGKGEMETYFLKDRKIGSPEGQNVT